MACGRAQGVAIIHLVGGAQHRQIVGKRLGIGAKPQSERRWHCHLQVGVARHQHMLIALTLGLEGAKQRGEVMHHLFNFASNKETKVDQHLVVARASGVNFLAHIAQTAGEHQFHLRMHVFNTLFYHKFSHFIFRINIAKGSGERSQFVGREEVDGLKHGDVGDGAQHIVARQIEVHFAVATHGVGFHIVVHRHILFPKF